MKMEAVPLGWRILKTWTVRKTGERIVRDLFRIAGPLRIAGKREPWRRRTPGVRIT